MFEKDFNMARNSHRSLEARNKLKSEISPIPSRMDDTNFMVKNVSKQMLKDLEVPGISGKDCSRRV